MNAEQRSVLRDFALGSHKWLALRIVAGGADALKGQQGGSYGDGIAIDYDSKGIRRWRPEPVVLVTRAQIQSWVNRLPPTAADEASRHVGEMGRSQREFPVFAASAAASGCGPQPSWHGKEGPITYAQWLYEQEHDAYECDRLMPWENQREAIHTAAEAFLVSLFEVEIGQVALFDMVGAA